MGRQGPKWIMNKLLIRKANVLVTNIIRDYGKYGKYEKREDGVWRRLRKGSSFRRTINYKKMKLFLLEKGFNESFLNKGGVITLRSIIKAGRLVREYRKWSEERENGKEI